GDAVEAGERPKLNGRGQLLHKVDVALEAFGQLGRCEAGVEAGVEADHEFQAASVDVAIGPLAPVDLSPLPEKDLHPLVEGFQAVEVGGDIEHEPELAIDAVHEEGRVAGPVEAGV